MTDQERFLFAIRLAEGLAALLSKGSCSVEVRMIRETDIIANGLCPRPYWSGELSGHQKYFKKLLEEPETFPMWYEKKENHNWRWVPKEASDVIIASDPLSAPECTGVIMCVECKKRWSRHE